MPENGKTMTREELLLEMDEILGLHAGKFGFTTCEGNCESFQARHYYEPAVYVAKSRYIRRTLSSESAFVDGGLPIDAKTDTAKGEPLGKGTGSLTYR